MSYQLSVQALRSKLLAEEGLQQWEEARACPMWDTAPTDPLQNTAEALSQAGDNSGKTCLRMGAQKSERRGGTTAPWQSRYSPQLKEETTLEQTSPAAHEAPHSGEQRYSWRNCSPWRAHTRADEIYEEEGVVDTTVCSLQLPCHPPCELTGQGWGMWFGESAVKEGRGAWRVGKKGELFSCWACFSLPESDSICNKLVNFPQAESVFPAMVIAKQFPCHYLNLLLYCFCFSYFIPLPYQTEGRMAEQSKRTGMWLLDLANPAHTS